jgi:hypothetical protein
MTSEWQRMTDGHHRGEAFLESALEDGILAEQCQRAARGSCMTGVKIADGDGLSNASKTDGLPLIVS